MSAPNGTAAFALSPEALDAILHEVAVRIPSLPSATLYQLLLSLNENHPSPISPELERLLTSASTSRNRKTR